jgi:hypothetical protein
MSGASAIESAAHTDAGTVRDLRVTNSTSAEGAERVRSVKDGVIADKLGGAYL